MFSALKIKYHPFLRLFSSLAFIVSLLFTFLVFFTEAFFYSGFLDKHFSLDPNWILLIFIALALICYLTNRRQPHAILKLIFFPVNEALILLILVYIFITQVENAHYANYVFSHFHLHPDLLLGVVKVAFVWKGLELLFFYERSILKRILQNLPLLGSLIVVLSILIVGSNLLFITTPTIEYCRYFLVKPFATFEQRRVQIMKEYAFYLFLNQHTPENAVIATPPQVGPWLVTGNAGYGRYYVYPRKMINGSREKPIPDGADYLLVSYYDWTNPENRQFGWPEQKIAAEKIWLFDRETHQVREFDHQDFDPLNPTFGQSWGLIKIKL